MPWARGIGVDVRLLDLLHDPAEELAAVSMGRLELLAGERRQVPVEVELLLEHPEGDLVVDRRRPLQESRAERLAQRHRVVLLRDRRQEAAVELDRLELDLPGHPLKGQL